MDRASTSAAIAALVCGLALPAGATTVAEAPSRGCPATFMGFAEVFLGDAGQRETFIAPHVLTTRLVDGQPEPKQASQTSAPEDALAMIAGLVDGGGAGLTEVLRLGARPQITLRKPDTDAQITLTFERRDCWILTRIDDESL